MSHCIQPSNSFKAGAKQEIPSPKSFLKVKTEEAQIGKAGMFEPSIHFHPNVKMEKIKNEHFMGDESGEGDILEPLTYRPAAKKELFAYDMAMDDLLNSMDPSFYMEFMHQPLNSSLDIDQNTDVKPMPSECASQMQKSQAQPESSYGNVKTDKGAYSGPTGMDDDEPIPKAQHGLSSGTTEMDNGAYSGSTGMNVNEPIPTAQHGSSSGTTEMDNGAQCGLSCGSIEMDDDDEPYWPLSGKPHFHMIFTKTHVTYPYSLGLPCKITPELPYASVPAVITYCGKRWEMVYNGDYKLKKFNTSWSKFVIDNKLKIGDGCFFELTENSPTRIKFRAQILRCPDLPNFRGFNSQTPIVID